MSPAPAGGRGWRLLVGLQCLGGVHLPTCLPPPDRSAEHPECVVPLAALTRGERLQWARWEAELG